MSLIAANLVGLLGILVMILCAAQAINTVIVIAVYAAILVGLFFTIQIAGRAVTRALGAGQTISKKSDGEKKMDATAIMLMRMQVGGGAQAAAVVARWSLPPLLHTRAPPATHHCA